MWSVSNLKSKKQRGIANRLGFAIQIAYLRFPGRPLSANEKYD
ncbi:hypothetical protein CN542_13775 [Bacillus pseudomycoides]|nr:hypothetical protein CN542_13775 [Bacillus pseudomycoides]